MMYEIIKDFKGSPDGCRVLDYETGQKLEINIDFPQDLADVAVAEGWAKETKAPAKKAPAKKAVKKKAAKK